MAQAEWLKKSQSLEEKIGMAMAKKANVLAVLRAWDKSGDGKVRSEHYNAHSQCTRLMRTVGRQRESTRARPMCTKDGLLHSWLPLC